MTNPCPYVATSYYATLPVIETKKESHGTSHITITFYSAPNGISFSIQCRLPSLTRAIYPTPSSPVFVSLQNAHCAAVSVLQEWAKHAHGAKKALWQFWLAYPELQEFDFSGGAVADT